MNIKQFYQLISCNLQYSESFSICWLWRLKSLVMNSVVMMINKKLLWLLGWQGVAECVWPSGVTSALRVNLWGRLCNGWSTHTCTDITVISLQGAWCTRNRLYRLSIASCWSPARRQMWKRGQQFQEDRRQFSWDVPVTCPFIKTRTKQHLNASEVPCYWYVNTRNLW